MSITKMTKDVQTYTNLPTTPNKNNGYPIETLRKTLDQASVDLKEHVNQMADEIDSQFVTKDELTKASIDASKISKASIEEVKKGLNDVKYITPKTLSITSITEKVPKEAWQYALFKNTMTQQEIDDIESNPSLRDIIDNNGLKKLQSNMTNMRVAEAQETLKKGQLVNLYEEDGIYKVKKGEKTIKSASVMSELQGFTPHDFMYEQFKDLDLGGGYFCTCKDVGKIKLYKLENNEIRYIGTTTYKSYSDWESPKLASALSFTQDDTTHVAILIGGRIDNSNYDSGELVVVDFDIESETFIYRTSTMVYNNVDACFTPNDSPMAYVNGYICFSRHDGYRGPKQYYTLFYSYKLTNNQLISVSKVYSPKSGSLQSYVAGVYPDGSGYAVGFSTPSYTGLYLLKIDVSSSGSLNISLSTKISENSQDYIFGLYMIQSNRFLAVVKPSSSSYGNIYYNGTKKPVCTSSRIYKVNGKLYVAISGGISEIDEQGNEIAKYVAPKLDWTGNIGWPLSQAYIPYVQLLKVEDTLMVLNMNDNTSVNLHNQIMKKVDLPDIKSPAIMLEDTEVGKKTLVALSYNASKIISDLSDSIEKSILEPHKTAYLGEDGPTTTLKNDYKIGYTLSNNEMVVKLYD